VIEEKEIYPPGFEYRGHTYPNDTALKTFDIEYDQNKVTSVYRYSAKFSNTIYYKSRDTLQYNCSFDKAFLNKPVRQGSELDSLHRIVKSTQFKIRHNSLGPGPCDFIASENDLIFTYHYNSHGQKSHIEAHLRSGQHISTEYFEYRENLIQKIWSPSSSTIRRYKYQYYP
jgi:hypothetical protein